MSDNRVQLFEGEQEEVIDTKLPDTNGVSYLGIEKRRNMRKVVSWNVKGQWSSGKIFETVTENISLRGIMIASKKKPIINEKAFLKISTYMYGQPYVIKAVAQVRHVSLSNNVYTCGMKIVKTTNESLLFIEDFMNNNNPHQMRVERAKTRVKSANH